MDGVGAVLKAQGVAQQESTLVSSMSFDPVSKRAQATISQRLSREEGGAKQFVLECLKGSSRAIESLVASDSNERGNGVPCLPRVSRVRMDDQISFSFISSSLFSLLRYRYQYQ